MQTLEARPETLDLRTAADELGVHYQTAYKWVRSGRLGATKVRGRYEVDTSEVERVAVERAEPDPPPQRRPRGGYGELAGRAFRLLMAGDENGLRKLVTGLLDSAVPLRTVIGEVLVPCLVEVGEQWSAGRLDIATEHRCSVLVERCITENMPNPRGRRRGTAVVTAAEGDLHSLPTTMAAAALREDNWRVHHLGANMPTDETVEFCEREQPDLVVVAVTHPERLASAEEVAERLAVHGISTLIGSPGASLGDLVSRAREVNRP